MILSPKEALLIEAEKLFPAGTHFVSLHGAVDYVRRTPVDKNGELGEPTYYVTNGEVRVVAYAGTRLIYSPTLGWAGII